MLLSVISCLHQHVVANFMFESMVLELCELDRRK
jgi:hypothetical protein